jgi:AcrR family transcriptional regulator
MKTDEKIMDTALRMFNEKGYVHVGVRDIARALGMSPGNLSYHFAKKEDLLFAILRRLSETNNQLYAEYGEEKPSNELFLKLMKAVFHNQFQYRGVYIGNQVIQQEIQNTGLFDYPALEQKRREIFRRIFRGLAQAGHLDLKTGDVEFFVSFMTLFGRFWISEATLLNKNREAREAVQHYISLLCRQMRLFATEIGAASIDSFAAQHLSPGS